MGIKGLGDLIKTVQRTKHISHFKDLTCTIDKSGFDYQFLRSPNYQRLHKNPILYGYLRQIDMLQSYNIKPIYILDGKPPKEKSMTTLSRRKTKANNIQRLEDLKQQLDPIFSQKRRLSTDSTLNTNNIEDLINQNDITLTDDSSDQLNDDDDTVSTDDESETIFDKRRKQELLMEQIEKKERQILYPTREDRELCKKLFELLGVDYIQSSSEADPIIYQLINDGEAHFAISKDYDILTYGTPTLITNLSLRQDAEMYNLDEVLQELEMTQSEFMELCVMCGCDYVSNIKGIGPKTALKYIKKHGSIQNTVDNLAVSFLENMPDDYIKLTEDAKNMFLNPHTVLYDRYTNVRRSDEEILAFLKEHELPTDVLKTKSQPKITDFFN